MNIIWRFYADQDKNWRWQQLSMDRTVITESRAACKNYEECVVDAREQGYVFHPSPPHVIRRQRLLKFRDFPIRTRT